MKSTNQVFNPSSKGDALATRALKTVIHNKREEFHYQTIPQCPPLSVSS